MLLLNSLFVTLQGEKENLTFLYPNDVVSWTEVTAAWRDQDTKAACNAQEVFQDSFTMEAWFRRDALADVSEAK